MWHQTSRTTPADALQRPQRNFLRGGSLAKDVEGPICSSNVDIFWCCSCRDPKIPKVPMWMKGMITDGWRMELKRWRECVEKIEVHALSGAVYLALGHRIGMMKWNILSSRCLHEKINAWRSVNLDFSDFSTGAAVLLDTSMSDIMNLNGHSWALDLDFSFYFLVLLRPMPYLRYWII